jgi:lipoprotein signal peptidase
MPLTFRSDERSLADPRHGLIAFCGGALLVGLIDATTKFAVWTMRPDTSIGDSLGLLRFHLHQNSGFMLGIGSSVDVEYRSLLLSAVTAMVLLGLIAYLLYRGFTRIDLALAWGAVVGSAAANLIERIRVGAVTDFLQLDLGGLQTGIFNFADLFNLAGLVYIAAAILFRSRAL